MNISNKDIYRPNYHFTPEKGWMNDPNGLVYYKDRFHLFYQHIPDNMTHSNDLHWGHATSRDLSKWEHQEIALSPDENGSNWSGSIIVDWQDTGNFQTGKHKTMVALYTQAINDVQCQSLAYSNDKGETWTSYKNNPVITNPGIKEFRPPDLWLSDNGFILLSGEKRELEINGKTNVDLNIDDIEIFCLNNYLHNK